MKRLELYTMDVNYMAALSKIDNKVMSVAAQQGKDSRPFVGVVIYARIKNTVFP